MSTFHPIRYTIKAIKHILYGNPTIMQKTAETTIIILYMHRNVTECHTSN